MRPPSGVLAHRFPLAAEYRRPLGFQAAAQPGGSPPGLIDHIPFAARGPEDHSKTKRTKNTFSSRNLLLLNDQINVIAFPQCGIIVQISG
jgi:hypothetical protein